MLFWPIWGLQIWIYVQQREDNKQWEAKKVWVRLVIGDVTKNTFFHNNASEPVSHSIPCLAVRKLATTCSTTTYSFPHQQIASFFIPAADTSVTSIQHQALYLLLFSLIALQKVSCREHNRCPAHTHAQRKKPAGRSLPSPSASDMHH